MKKKVKLAFAQLENELQLIPAAECKTYFGGEDDSSSGLYIPNIDWGSFMSSFDSNLLAGYESSSSGSSGGSSGYSLPPIDSSGFSFTGFNSSGLSQLQYNGQTIDGSLGMVNGKLTLQLDYSDFSFKLGRTIPGYSTPPSDFPPPSPPNTGTTYEVGFIWNF